MANKFLIKITMLTDLEDDLYKKKAYSQIIKEFHRRPLAQPAAEENPLNFLAQTEARFKRYAREATGKNAETESFLIFCMQLCGRELEQNRNFWELNTGKTNQAPQRHQLLAGQTPKDLQTPKRASQTIRFSKEIKKTPDSSPERVNQGDSEDEEEGRSRSGSSPSSESEVEIKILEVKTGPRGKARTQERKRTPTKENKPKKSTQTEREPKKYASSKKVPGRRRRRHDIDCLFCHPQLNEEDGDPQLPYTDSDDDYQEPVQDLRITINRKKLSKIIPIPATGPNAL